MGDCQANIPCTQEIKPKIEMQAFGNDINVKDIIVKDKKKSNCRRAGHIQ